MRLSDLKCCIILSDGNQIMYSLKKKEKEKEYVTFSKNLQYMYWLYTMC